MIGATPNEALDGREPYRVALLNGGLGTPTGELVRAFEKDPGTPAFETATFSALEDLLAHLEASTRRGAHVDVVLIGPDRQERFAAARSVRERDARVQVIFLASASELLRIRRAVLFNPLLSDMWSADVEDEAEILVTLVRDAAGGTRRRRRLRSALEQINLQLESVEALPQASRPRPTASDRYLASLLTLAPDVIVSTDLDGRIVSWNRAASRAFGRSLDEAIGMPLSGLFTRRPARAARRLLAAVRAGESIRQQQITCRRANGSVFEGEVTLAPVHDEAGNRIGLSMIARDVSERVRERLELQAATERLELLVEELTARTAEAEAASRAKSEFLAAVSHELRTPLQGVIGFASLLDDNIAGPLSDAQRHQVRRIRANADHLLELIDQLLELSRNETVHFHVDRRTFDLYAVAVEAVDAVRVHAEEAGLQISAPEPPEAHPRHAFGDPRRVRQILLNLLSNAMKFTDRGGVVVEVASTDPPTAPEARVAVRDTGIGLTPGEIERIFDAFFQVRTGFSARAPGLGLGLAISRRLAEAMGGRIEVRSEPGSGSEFTLILPAPEPGGSSA